MKNLEKQFFKKKPHVLSLMLLSAFAVMGALVLTPSLPNIAKFFDVTPGAAKMTVTLFLFGYAVGQLVYAPIANRFGRKPAFHFGILIATLGSIFSIIASPVESFDLLLLGRFLEALGASAGLVVAFTVVDDFYAENKRKVMAIIMLAFAIVPGIAITVGGLIAQYLNWQYCFYFLLFYGLLLIIPVCRLPETLSKSDVDLHALKAKKLLRNYFTEFKNAKIIGFSICSGLSSGSLYAFGAQGPFIGIHLLNTPAAIYGFLALIPYIGTLIGSLVAMRLHYINPFHLLKLSFLCQVLAAIVMFLLFITHLISLWSLLAPMILLCFGHPIIAATANSMAMNSAKNKSNGSAITTFTAMSVAMFITLLLGVFHTNAPILLPAILFLSLGLMCSTYFLCRLER